MCTCNINRTNPAFHVRKRAKNIMTSSSLHFSPTKHTSTSKMRLVKITTMTILVLFPLFPIPILILHHLRSLPSPAQRCEQLLPSHNFSQPDHLKRQSMTNKLSYVTISSVSNPDRFVCKAWLSCDTANTACLILSVFAFSNTLLIKTLGVVPLLPLPVAPYRKLSILNLVLAENFIESDKNINNHLEDPEKIRATYCKLKRFGFTCLDPASHNVVNNVVCDLDFCVPTILVHAARMFHKFSPQALDKQIVEQSPPHIDQQQRQYSLWKVLVKMSKPQERIKILGCHN